MVHATPSFETRDAAQKYLMTRMFANHHDFKVVHTAHVGMVEATGDEKFDTMMGGITSKDSLNTKEALGLLQDLLHQGGASYDEALQQASASFEIDPAFNSVSFEANDSCILHCVFRNCKSTSACFFSE